MTATARTALRRMGNSTGMIVPKAVLSALRAQAGEPLDVAVRDGRLVAARVGDLPPEGELTLSDGEARELEALSEELKAAAERMASQLDAAIAALRDAGDIGRDALYRRRALEELARHPSVADLDDLFG